MIYVYKLPEKLSDGYCFDGGNPIKFLNVDWFNEPPGSRPPKEIRKFISGKSYFTEAPPGTMFLSLCPMNPSYTFIMARF